MKSIQIVSIIIAMLVIMITPAYAAQLDITQYSGATETNGYASSNDQIKIKATATMYGSPTTEIAAKRLQAKHSGVTEKFNTCATFGQNTYKCEYTTTGLYAGAESFTIELLDADGKVIETVQKIIEVDNLKPSITEFNVNPAKTSSNKVTVNYKTEDYLRTTGDGKCSGIKEVKFLVNNQKVIAETGQKEQCFAENTLDYTRSVGDYAKVTLCAKAVDYVGQESDAVCRDYEIDQKPPVIKEIHLKDADGFEMTGMRPGAQLVGSVEAIVEGDNNDVTTVTADLSSINPSLAGQTSPDETYGTSYVWRNVAITNPSTCQITVVAVDDMGNEARQTKQCSIPTDDLGPEPVSITTNYTDEDGTYMIGTKGTIKLDIREPGAGLFRKNVYMDLSALGSQYSMDQRANECHVKTLDVWECTWIAEPKVPNGDYTIRTRPTTRDDLDTPATLAVQITLRVDKQPPTVEKVDFSVQHAFAQYGDKVVKGDLVEFKIQTTGTHMAYSNFTSIGGSYAAGTCAGNSTKTCTFSQTVFKSGPNNATITFDFYDRADNVKKYPYNLVIYGLMNETTPEYWNSTVMCSPSLIDRSTTMQKEEVIYCHIKLTSANKDAKPVYSYVNPADCTNVTSAIIGIEMMNNGMNSKDPYLVITLAPTEFSINELRFSCPVLVSSKVGNFFSKTDEKEMANVKLEFYDLPMGEIYDNLETDINHRIRLAMNQMSWINDAQIAMKWAEYGCGLKSTFSGMLGALDGLLGLFPPLILLLSATGKYDEREKTDRLRNAICNNIKGPLEKELFGGEANEGFLPKETGTGKKEGDKTSKGIWQFLEMLCDFVNCKLTWDADKYGQFAEFGDAMVAFGGGGIGGKEGICSRAENFLGGDLAMGGEAYKNYQELQKTMNPKGEPVQRLTDVKESLFWSTACQCVPGIIYNVNKLRQINCKNAICLAEDIKKQGYDPSWCTAEKSYLTCTYVMGEIFSVFPFVTILDRTVNTIKEWFENPISSIAAATGCACGGCAQFGIDPFFCDEKKKDKEISPEKEAIGYIVCILPKTASKVLDAVASGMALEKTINDMKTGTTYCDQARDMGLNRRYSG